MAAVHVVRLPSASKDEQRCGGMALQAERQGEPWPAESLTADDAYDTELYTGKSDNVLCDGERDCGVSGNVVVRLSRSIPNCILIITLTVHSYNSSLLGKPLMCLGKVRSNRVPRSITVSDADLKKRGRGSFVEKVSEVDGIEIASAHWFDNKAVHFLSTFTSQNLTKKSPDGMQKRNAIAK